MFYVLIVKDAPIEEICGITTDKVFAEWWLSEGMNGIAPKRIMREFEDGVIVPSYLEHKWGSNVSS